MSLMKGFQLYDMQFKSDNINPFLESPEGKRLIVSLEEQGLVVEAYAHNSGNSTLVRIYHPTRTLQGEDYELVDYFFSSCHGGFCGTGFVGEVGKIDGTKYTEIYRTPTPVKQEDKNRPLPDSEHFQAATDALLAAIDLNDQFRDTGEQINQMQIDHLIREMERVNRLKKPGKFTVLVLDKFDGVGWVEGYYDTQKEAFEVAERESRDSLELASDLSVATVYYVYGHEGRLLWRFPI